VAYIFRPTSRQNSIVTIFGRPMGRQV